MSNAQILWLILTVDAIVCVLAHRRFDLLQDFR